MARSQSKLENKKFLIIFVLVAAILLLIAVFWPQAVVSTTSFGQCLSEKGIKMYGNDNCPHCRDQKEILGEEFQYVDYVNCDFNDAECRENGVKYYPTWTNGIHKIIGTQSLPNLAKFSGCELTK